MKIAVAGTGYVGLSMATLLAQNNEVMAVDIMAEKVEKINRRDPNALASSSKNICACQYANARLK